MAFSGLPEPTERCPGCGETLQYNAATRSYLHVLGICRRLSYLRWRNAQDDVASGNVWPEEV